MKKVPVEFKIALSRIKAMYGNNLPSEDELFETILMVTRRYNLPARFVIYALKKLNLSLF